MQKLLNYFLIHVIPGLIHIIPILAVEMWLGRTTKVKANSTFDLVVNLFRAVLAFFTRKK